MAIRKAFAFVQRDTIQSLNWAMEDYEKLIKLRYFTSLEQLKAELGDEKNPVLCIIETGPGKTEELGVASAARSRETPHKVLMIVSGSIPREDLKQIVQEKAADSIVLKPFSAKQVADTVEKITGIQNPANASWFQKG